MVKGICCTTNEVVLSGDVRPTGTWVEFIRPPLGKGGGGSDYAFADGSARYLRYGLSITPVNLWAIEDSWRTNTVKL